MSGRIEKRLTELGLELGAPSAPAANYVPYVISGNQVFISGQIPMNANGIQFQGKVGADLTLDQGRDDLFAVAFLQSGGHTQLLRQVRC